MIDPDDKDEKTTEEAVVTNDKSSETSSETAADAQATTPTEEKASEPAKEVEKPVETKSSGMPPLKREEPLPAPTPSAPTKPVVETPAPTRKPTAAPKQTTQPKAPPAPPPRKKRRDGTLSAMSGFLSFLLVMLVAGVFGVIAMMHKLKEPGPLAQDKIVYMPPGSETSEMVAQLQREGVIDNPSLMYYALLVSGARNKLKPEIGRAHV